MAVVSAAATLGKGFGKGVRSDLGMEEGDGAVLTDTADSLAQVETVIAREGIGATTHEWSFQRRLHADTPSKPPKSGPTMGGS